MLELNRKDYRYRIENHSYLLAYNVITNKMYFFKGKVKEYLITKINENKDLSLEKKYLDYLMDQDILVKGEI